MLAPPPRVCTTNPNTNECHLTLTLNIRFGVTICRYSLKTGAASIELTVHLPLLESPQDIKLGVCVNACIPVCVCGRAHAGMRACVSCARCSRP